MIKSFCKGSGWRKLFSPWLWGVLGWVSVYSQEILWLRRFDRGAGVDDYCGRMIFDHDNNLLLTGGSWSLATGSDMLLIKYTSSGDTIWTRYYDGGENEQGYDIALDHDGNIIVAGYCSNDTIESQCLLVKFSPEGNFLWERKYRHWDMDMYTGVVIDDENNIIVSVWSYTYSGGGRYIGLIQKYDAMGSLIWSRPYNWVSDFYAIAKLPVGGFIVTGTDTTRRPMLTVRLDSLGDTIWTRRDTVSGFSLGAGGDIALDSSGNIIVVGYLSHVLDYNLAVVKYTLNGDTVWTRELNFTPNDWAGGVATDVIGNIFVSGNSGMAMDSIDGVLVKYTESGDTLWATFYDGGYDDRFFPVVVDTDGNPIVSGSSHNGTDYDIVTIKYQSTPGIKELFTTGVTPQLNVSPNPAKGTVSLKLPYPVAEVRIYDVSGKLQRVIPLRVSKGAANTQNVKISLNGLATGTYFIEAGGKTAKLVVRK
jgi:hypothetical protein